jgi:hypothetical protein
MMDFRETLDKTGGAFIIFIVGDETFKPRLKPFSTRDIFLKAHEDQQEN